MRRVTTRWKNPDAAMPGGSRAGARWVRIVALLAVCVNECAAAACPLARPRFERVPRLPAGFPLSGPAAWSAIGGEGGAVVPTAGGFGFRVDPARGEPGAWPFASCRPETPWDWSPWAALEFDVLATPRAGPDDSEPSLHVQVLHGANEEPFWGLIPPLGFGQRAVGRVFLDYDARDTRAIQFYAHPSRYAQGFSVDFEISDFRFVARYAEPPVDPRGARLSLRVGSGDILPVFESVARVPLHLRVEFGDEWDPELEPRLRLRLRNVFTGTDVTWMLGGRVPVGAGKVVEIESVLDLARACPGMPAGMIHVRSDLVSGSRVWSARAPGSACFYLAAPEETPESISAGCQLGSCAFRVNRFCGGLLRKTHETLPATYDPFEPETYRHFLHGFAIDTCNYTEILQYAGLGLLRAIPVYDSAGREGRARFASAILAEITECVLNGLQETSGACLTSRNRLSEYWPDVPREYNTDRNYNTAQVGQMLLLYSRIIDEAAPGYVGSITREQLLDASRRGAEFLRTEAIRSDPEFGTVAEVRRFPYHEREVMADFLVPECRVYDGWVLSGLSYHAVVLARAGFDVPAWLLNVLRDHARFGAARMDAHDDWYDWHCGDDVEGGCHTWLGNYYIAEGFLGSALAFRILGDDTEARYQAELCRRALRYVTNRCVVRGKRFDPEGNIWDSGYAWFLFGDYIDHFGPEPVLEAFRRRLPGVLVRAQQGRGFYPNIVHLTCIGALAEADRDRDRASHRP